MLVVDRRDDQNNYAPGANRAKVQAELERKLADHGPLESTAVPAQVAVDDSDTRNTGRGVACVIETPGQEVLLQILLGRVWGVSHNSNSN